MRKTVSERGNRLASIVLMLKASRSLTAESLAKELGVTVRTVYRDLEDLASAGIPIRGMRGPAGGYELAEYFPIDPFVYLQADPPRVLTKSPNTGPNELDAAARVLAEALPPKLRENFDRLRQRLLFDSSAWFWHDPRRIEFAELKRAVLHDEIVEIAYTPRATADINNAVVDPHGLVWKQGHWYLVAWSNTQGKFERYRLGRILAVRQTGRNFKRQPRFDLPTVWVHLMDEFGRGKSRVRIRIDYPATKDFEAFLWKEDQHIVKHSDYWIVEMAVDSDEWIVPLALSYGDKVQVLEPQSLRNRLAGALESALRIYKSRSRRSQPRRGDSSDNDRIDEPTTATRGRHD